MKIDAQIAAVRASQGARPDEQQMLGEASASSTAPMTLPGVNTTEQLEVASGQIVFDEPFSGIHVANATAFWQKDNRAAPLHEMALWRLAVALGTS